jgi:hypothetical protein
MNKQRIAEKLRENYQNFAEEVSALSKPDFIFSADGKWTAGQQLDHLVRAVAPVKTALSLPKFVPKLLFGKIDRCLMDYDQVVATYQGKLAAGSKASRRFIPPGISFEKREKLRDKLLTLVKDLTVKIENFNEAQLDKYLLPHPILGKLTVREMLYFTIYHCQHHHRAVLRNLGK